MSNKRSAILELFRKGMRQCDIVRFLNVPKANCVQGHQSFQGARPRWSPSRKW